MDRFFIHISKKWVKALYYLALTHFLATILSTMPPFFVQAKKVSRHRRNTIYITQINEKQQPNHSNIAQKNHALTERG